MFEDDAIICENFKETLHIYMNSLPADWDVLFIGQGGGMEEDLGMVGLEVEVEESGGGEDIEYAVLGIDIEASAQVFEGHIGSPCDDGYVSVQAVAVEFSEEGMDIHPALDVLQGDLAKPAIDAQAVVEVFDICQSVVGF